jgi:filamentous hemagglutinin
MSKTITGTTTLGVTLSASTTIIDGTIATAGQAIYGSAAKTWTLTNNGHVSASQSDGIYVKGGANIKNTAHANIIGQDGGIALGGRATISNAGTIASNTGFGNAIFLAAGGAVTNSAGGLLRGGVGRASGSTASLTLVNQGLISGNFSYAINATGTITNAKSGTISGLTGVELSGGTINNAGLIEAVSGGGTAISLSGSLYSDIIEQKSGTIIGAMSGFIGGDTIDEAGIIITSASFANNTLSLFSGTAKAGTLNLPGNFTSRDFALQSDGHGGTDILLGAETFTGTYGFGVSLTALTSTVAANADVTGYNYGVFGSAYRHFTLVNHGTIAAAGNTRAGVKFITAGYIANTGLITGAEGIYFDGGTISNTGTIAGTAGTAINILHNTATSMVILKSGGKISGAIAGFEAGDTIDLSNITATGDVFGNGVLTLTNAGAVAATIALSGGFNSAAFTVGKAPGGGTDISIAPTETFSGHYKSGLVLSSLFTSIASNASFTYLDALYGRPWTVVNAGTINAGYDGVFIVSGQFTNASTGTVSGATGIYNEPLGNAAVSISNAGTIIGTGKSGTGVSLSGAAALTNLVSGTITGSLTGVSLSASTLANAGLIQGRDGLVLTGGAASNSGHITGAGGPAAYTYQDTGLLLYRGAATNAATGLIAGPIGARVDGGNLVNAGIIEGLPGGVHGSISVASEGLYIEGGGVTNAAHAVISGNIGAVLDGGALSDAGTIASTLGGAGIAVTFGGTGATLVLDIGNVITGAIAGLKSGDIVDFAATTITADSFANHILTLQNGAATVEKLTLAGTFQQSQFTLVPLGTLGTELIIGPTAAIAAPMAFLRPAFWGPRLTLETQFHPPAPATVAPAVAPAAAASLAGWINLHQPQPTPITAVTLHAG